MAHARYADKRDGNDAELTRALQAMVCCVWHLGRSPCDKLILCPDGRLELAEIKDPTQRTKLTKTEEETAAALQTRGRHLWILQTVDDCAAIVANRIMELEINANGTS